MIERFHDGRGSPAPTDRRTPDGMLHFALTRTVAETIRLAELVPNTHDAPPDGHAEREVRIDCSREVAHAIVSRLVAVARGANGPARVPCALAALPILRLLNNER